MACGLGVLLEYSGSDIPNRGLSWSDCAVLKHPVQYLYLSIFFLTIKMFFFKPNLEIHRQTIERTVENCLTERYVRISFVRPSRKSTLHILAEM